MKCFSVSSLYGEWESLPLSYDFDKLDVVELSIVLEKPTISVLDLDFSFLARGSVLSTVLRLDRTPEDTSNLPINSRYRLFISFERCREQL